MEEEEKPMEIIESEKEEDETKMALSPQEFTALAEKEAKQI